MKLTCTRLLISILFFSTLASAQNNNSSLELRTGKIVMEPNLRSSYIDSFNVTAKHFKNKVIAILSFETIPSVESRKLLFSNGIELLSYLSLNTYTASISLPLSLSVLLETKSGSLMQLAPHLKIDPVLKNSSLPPWIVKVPGTIDVIISFPKTYSPVDIVYYLREKSIEIVSEDWISYGKITIRIPVNQLAEIANFPFVEYIGLVTPDPHPLNENSRDATRANVLNNSIANGGLGLNGEGVVVGIGDNVTGKLQVDFAGRLIQRNTIFDAAHGIHVMGTAAGAGIVNELYQGFAPKSTIIDAVQSSILSPLWVQEYNMVVTNNSYGGFVSCDYSGKYEIVSQVMDSMAINLPNLLNVFGVGNSGATTCAPYLPGFNTVLGWWQSAKNTLAVGATTDSSFIGGFSSRGPAMDGRIKPEIVAMGQRVVSTWPDNIYGYNNGTSMSAPAVTGGLALLYQRYRQLHNGSDPKNGLMKAIICNGATDKGNPGPDYTYGFGMMNLLRSVDILDKQHFYSSGLGHNENKTHSIVIPPGTAQLKVMLYWNDPAGSLLNRQALVNDLDLEVIDPSSSITLPKVLETIPANVNNVAGNSVDHINNIEQVVIDLPAAGNYSFKVKGSAIVQNPTQEYFLVYDVIPISLTLTSPVGAEGFEPGEFVKIAWDAYGNNSNSFTLQYSTDNGSTWMDINSNIDPARRIYTWQVPQIVTSGARIKILQNGTSLNDISHPFTIIGVPVISLSAIQCESYIGVSWDRIPGAIDYEMMLLKGNEMKSIGFTTDTNFNINSLSKDSVYWVGVRARVNGRYGRRSVSISRRPNDGNCFGTISDNDLSLEAIVSPRSGRKYTSSGLTANHVVTIRIKNFDDVAISGVTIKYSLNGSPWITENVNAVIAPGVSYDHRFASPVDFSALGNYVLTAVVKNNSADAITANDTLVNVVRHLDNQPLDLSGIFLDDLETAISYTYKSDTIGLAGIERYDFESKLNSGELTSFINTGIAYSGNRSLIMGENFRHAPPPGKNYLTGTFNLLNYTAAGNDIRLDFRYARTTIGNADTLWARGADDQPWIRVFTLPRTTGGLYNFSPGIDISDSLAAHGQNFSSSFQVRWGQSTVSQSLTRNTIFSLDDIRWYQVFNDVQLVKVDTPSLMSCSANGIVPVTISVHNHHNSTLANIPVKYSIDDVNWVSETIGSIPGNTTIKYTFSQLLNLPSQNPYKLKALVSYASDSYRVNDSASTDVQSVVLVSSNSHLQNFESGAGGWYAAGTNSSWEYGTPASPKIKAAASGSKAWKTKLSGNYHNLENSYLYSPCYRLTGLTRPALSFSMAEDIEDCSPNYCDVFRLEYTVNGKDWLVLNNAAGIINWYTQVPSQGWRRQDNTRWHVVTALLPANAGNIRFRFNMISDSSTNREGVAIDDFHVYDNSKGIFDSITLTAPITQTVSGNGWVDFAKEGKLIASIHPNNQSLGSTDVQAYIHNDPVRHTATQYYHNRSITIKPTNSTLTDSVMVRYYFLDKETDTLIRATGCAGCTKPSHAYELGISKYDDGTDSFENGSIADNKTGNWSFLNKSNIAIVPFDKGYYAEFKVKGFSEFWLNNGGQDSNSHIAVKLLEFTAKKIASTDVLLQWKMATDEEIVRYEIELSRGDIEFQANHFVMIGELPSQGNTGTSFYNLTDNETDKFGVRYYRLKIIYGDGRFSYSEVRSVVYEEAVLWKVFPNPSAGIFYLICQVNQNEKLNAKIFDAKGSLVKEFQLTGTGSPQKFSIDLKNQPYAGAMYLLQVNSGTVTRTFKLYKQ